MEPFSPPHAIHAESDYTLEHILGEGSSGKTYMATHKVTGAVFACKTITKKSTTWFDADLSPMKREIGIMKGLSRPNIITLRDCYQDPDTFYLVMDFCSGGTLSDQMDVKGRYTESEAASVTRQIVEALKFCHNHNVIHHDLKPDNIVFADKETSTLKIIDFGLSMRFQPGQPLRSQHYGGLSYKAPELFLKSDYGPEVDIWSAGVILYEMLIGKLPFIYDRTNRRPEITLGIAVCKGFKDFNWRQELPDLSEDAIDLLKNMLLREPSDHLTAENVLGHPWILQNTI